MSKKSGSNNRFSVKRKTEAVLRLLRGEDLELVSREYKVTAATLSQWREAFLAGGQAGMKHFLEQFGPCLQSPWTKLTDVPDLDDDLINRIVEQSDEQAAGRSVSELERERDANLVAILKTLRQEDCAAGAFLNCPRASSV